MVGPCSTGPSHPVNGAASASCSCSARRRSRPARRGPFLSVGGPLRGRGCSRVLILQRPAAPGTCWNGALDLSSKKTPPGVREGFAGRPGRVAAVGRRSDRTTPLTSFHLHDSSRSVSWPGTARTERDVRFHPEAEWLTVVVRDTATGNIGSLKVPFAQVGPGETPCG